MSELLRKLGDNWHVDHVYDRLILSILPDTKHKKRIENYLYQIYVDSHYDYKSWRHPPPGTIYDLEIDLFRGQKKALEEKYTKEEETFTKLCEKFQTLGGAEKDDNSEGGDQEEEEEDEEEEIVQVKGQKDTKVVSKGTGKEAAAKAREQERHRQLQLKQTKANMAATQQTLIDIQKEIETLDTKIEYYGHYQYADRGLSLSLRKIILEYAKTNDDEVLIRNLDDIIDYHEMIKRRYVPKDPCRGGKGLCATHHLPLFASKWSKDGEILAAECSVSPFA